MWMRLGLWTTLIASCGGNSQPVDPDADPHAPDAPPAMNSIAGDVGGLSFTTPMTVLRAGSPDDPATTVVYMFDHIVQCSEIIATGWDKRVQDHTQALEIKLRGHSVKSYLVSSGDALINYTLTSTTGTPVESLATNGSAALEAAVADGTKAQGNFDITFATGHLSGRFDATFCPGGKEP